MMNGADLWIGTNKTTKIARLDASHLTPIYTHLNAAAKQLYNNTRARKA